MISIIIMCFESSKLKKKYPKFETPIKNWEESY